MPDLVADRKDAQVVVEARSGALSNDQQNFLIGIPSFNIPVPFASGTLPFPELALYADNDQKGVAKFALTGFDAKTGALIDAQDPQYGFADNEHKTLLFLISWSKTDAIPADERYHPTNGTGSASLSSEQPTNGNGTAMATNK